MVYSMMYFNCQTSFYIERKRRGREQESGETEKERVCVRDGEWQKEEVASVVKWAIEET